MLAARQSMAVALLALCAVGSSKDLGDEFAAIQGKTTVKEVHPLAAAGAQPGVKKLNVTLGIRSLYVMDRVSIETTMTCHNVSKLDDDAFLSETKCHGTTEDTMLIHYSEHKSLMMEESMMTIDGSAWIFQDKYKIDKTCHACGETCNITVGGISWLQKLPECWNRTRYDNGHDLPLEVPLKLFEQVVVPFSAAWDTTIFEAETTSAGSKPEFETFHYSILMYGGWPDM
uniref:Uncharacterized protein n=1 Tax=Alexandrium catenella TaxID=2925 RepID=A0A7S1SCH5_ALECA|mmetsp:Transcript_95503/g.253726  ORF Transcript_95503/g.253726 Transcript_95503/m.253726 type:complete len:229 (+) Transcript_95503:67-753(+)